MRASVLSESVRDGSGGVRGWELLLPCYGCWPAVDAEWMTRSEMIADCWIWMLRKVGVRFVLHQPGRAEAHGSFCTNRGRVVSHNPWCAEAHGSTPSVSRIILSPTDGSRLALEPLFADGEKHSLSARSGTGAGVRRPPWIAAAATLGCRRVSSF
jgi:hypothetical protein